jgi:ABC-type protease/lipase transport system fused ATPase/permease subunit
MEKEREKELVELYETAKKAADASSSTDSSPSEESRCLDALEQLKKFPVNYKFLVNTQVIYFFIFCFFYSHFIIGLFSIISFRIIYLLYFWFIF